jgi:hypothetical protein
MLRPSELSVRCDHSAHCLPALAPDWLLFACGHVRMQQVDSTELENSA